ncbi:ribonuclease D [Neptunicoccus cionae]|uniref:Ribonuclease D n=1 Tax=Neptunicoccus cionae TaxID=2035344 RepID=A0A916VRY5_9RHOB|nr:ribonuclease D [Amylibacter cionae]GGA24412.1 ribonuclease D [Amylibacter cionae]
MKTITTTEQLAEFCAQCAKFDYVTIDTEFLRERTYYSKLCLIQMAHPGEGDEGAVLIDVLEPELSLDPLYELFQDESVVKVFHAARQDLEIFYVDRGIFPKPFFDTQVAAMVCGFGEQVGYETLVRKIAKAQLDKSSRFTDWSARPLSEKQKHYALGDVTHLREIYEFLKRKLHQTKRTSWVEEEVEILTNPETYNANPDDAWKRLKTRSNSRRFLATVQELAKFREAYAQERNIPRNRVFKDDALMEVAATRPKAINDLGKSRLLLREARKGAIGEGILASVKAADAIPSENLPQVAKVRQRPQGSEGLADLLRVLLKAKAEESGVAQKLIANASDLDDIAAGLGAEQVFRGWRNEVFGRDAKDLCDGKVALSADGSSVKIVHI